MINAVWPDRDDGLMRRERMLLLAMTMRMQRPDRPSDLPNYRVYVLDGGLEPVPAGVVGRALHLGCWVWRGAIWAVRG